MWKKGTQFFNALMLNFGSVPSGWTLQKRGAIYDSTWRDLCSGFGVKAGEDFCCYALHGMHAFVVHGWLHRCPFYTLVNANIISC